MHVTDVCRARRPVKVLAGLEAYGVSCLTPDGACPLTMGYALASRVGRDTPLGSGGRTAADGWGAFAPGRAERRR